MRYRNIEERVLANTYVDEETGCWLWLGSIDRNGYGKISVRVNGKHRKVKIHRLVMEVFCGLKLTQRSIVNHLCCIRHCCNPEHLETTGHKGNARYREKVKRERDADVY